MNKLIKVVLVFLSLTIQGCAGLADSEIKISDRFAIWIGTMPAKIIDKAGDVDSMVISDIERYIINENSIYVVGYYSMPNYADLYYDLQSRRLERRETSDMSESSLRYAILDVGKELLVDYKNLEDVPEKLRHFFTDEIGYWCSTSWGGHKCYKEKN